MKATDEQLMLIKQMLAKRGADVRLDIINPAEGRVIAECKIVDASGGLVNAVVDSEQYNPRSKKRVSIEEWVGCKAIEKAFTKYMGLLTESRNIIIEENGLRTSEILDKLEKCLKNVIEKSLLGEDYIANLDIGKQIVLTISICAVERAKINISISNDDGIVVFEKKGITVKESDSEACVQWLYARCENCFQLINS